MENKTASALILATILYTPSLHAAANSPLTQLSAGDQSPVINANNATFYYGLTETRFNALLEQHEDRLIKKLLTASGDVDPEVRDDLKSRKIAVIPSIQHDVQKKQEEQKEPEELMPPVPSHSLQMQQEQQVENFQGLQEVPQIQEFQAFEEDQDFQNPQLPLEQVENFQGLQEVPQIQEFQAFEEDQDFQNPQLPLESEESLQMQEITELSEL
ncbi:hypothetical protein GKODMF_09235 [Candidatus Electrothrix gigas]